MTRRSAGILAYRWRQNSLEVLLGHPGGPFWSRRDEGTWSIPKGEYEGGEDPEAAARREFVEETGWVVTVPVEPLGEIRQRGGKIVTAYAARADFDPTTLVSNAFRMEWPPGSGRMRPFPEIDRAQWFTLAEAEAKIVPGQAGFLDRLAAGLPGTRTNETPPLSTAFASLQTSFDADQGAASAAMHHGSQRRNGMPEVKDLAPNFRHVRLLLAREKDHPQGETDEGYDLLVPLDKDGRLDADTWRKNAAACRVRRFTDDGDVRIGRLRRKPGGQWYFDYEAGESDDEIGFRLGEERFMTGEYISVGRAQAMRTYQVARVEKP